MAEMPAISVVRCRSDELGGRVDVLRSMFDEAWSGEGGFDDVEWEHAIGGTHFLVEIDGRVRSHVSVVPRVLEADGRSLRTGYVEAVATWRADRRRGYAGLLMREAAAEIDASAELGALGTDLFAFYERLGWRRWLGPLGVRTSAGTVRTPEEEGFVMIRRTPATPPIDVGGTLTCDPRPGDVW